MTELEKLQEKPRNKRTPIEQCIVDATTFEEAEHDGEIELMEQAAQDLARLRDAVSLVIRRRDVGNLLEAIDALKRTMKGI